MTNTRLSVLGVDGCPGGWAVARAEFAVGSGGEPLSLTVDRSADLTAALGDVRSGSAAAAAVDMPIGLLDDRPRQAEIDARTLLGPRRSSVFATPVRAVLGASDYRDACARSRAVIGKAISQQAFHLLPKIAQLDSLVTADDQERWVEGHPELAFARLAGRPVELPKHQVGGRRLRTELLWAVFGPLLDQVMEQRLDRARSPAIPVGDVLDAVVLTLTARRLVNGDATRLGTVDGRPELDPFGRRVEIVF